MNGTLTVDTSRRKRKPGGYITKASINGERKVTVATRGKPVSSPQTQTTRGKPKTPPVTLVKTWLWMYREAKEYELRECARKNLILSLGSVADAEKFVKNNS
ncbi:hypothetical protein [Alteromonas sp. 14N.309.X.WAT.G.H12]|uniref:hypothetical protein n=1 Tax=Alteromonas sp. 14N.309.X.WAT.G.H12 TaxID=3120824 RepID=UPI002FD7791D